jgi:hypothetical protein
MNTKPKIKPFVHYCTIRHGDLAGNKVAHQVDPWEYQFGQKCKHCGYELATTPELVAHIYQQLTQDMDFNK